MCNEKIEIEKIGKIEKRIKKELDKNKPYFRIYRKLHDNFSSQHYVYVDKIRIKKNDIPHIKNIITSYAGKGDYLIIQEKDIIEFDIRNIKNLK